MPDELSRFCRYLHLAWGKYELHQGKKNNARLLLERGHLLNPKDAAILQAGTLLQVSCPADVCDIRLVTPALDHRFVSDSCRRSVVRCGWSATVLDGSVPSNCAIK